MLGIKYRTLWRKRTLVVVRGGVQWARWASKQSGPLAVYHERVSQGKLQHDYYQESVIARIQRLHEQLKSYSPPQIELKGLASFETRKRGWFDWLWKIMPRSSQSVDEYITTKHPGGPHGIYLHGDVGCGKTMLMDIFYETIPGRFRRKRIHFHQFMLSVHRRMHKLIQKHGNSDKIVPYIAAEMAQEASVLCFDEFQVLDIADAMILRRLLVSMLSRGVVLFTTSNRAPDDLYKNGIQRENFVPCIELLKKRLDVIDLDSQVDYRRIEKPLSDAYFYPVDKHTQNAIEKWFRRLGDPENDPPRSRSLQVWGRSVDVPSASGTAAKFTFRELCGRPYSASDYIALCRHFKSFIVTDIPQLTDDEHDQARRFITFIDTCYESRSVLIISAHVKADQIFSSNVDAKYSEQGSRDVFETDFTADEEKFAFHRCLSRLSEMARLDWIGQNSKG